MEVEGSCVGELTPLRIPAKPFSVGVFDLTSSPSAASWAYYGAWRALMMLARLSDKCLDVAHSITRGCDKDSELYNLRRQPSPRKSWPSSSLATANASRSAA